MYGKRSGIPQIELDSRYLMNSIERPFFFHNKKAKLFGVLHAPENEEAKQGFVFCHPFMEEKLWTHRVFVSFARELVKKGYAVLRFDHYGHGDSEGAFKDADINGYLSDINTAIEQLKGEVPSIEHVNLLGMRFGCMTAATISEQRDDIHQLILWEPVIDGARYMQEMLRSNLATQMAVFGEVKTKRDELVEQMKSGNTVNVDGYDISHALYEQGSSLSLKGDKKFKGDCLIIQMNKKLQQPIKKDLQELSDSYQRSSIAVVEEMAFWREIKESYFRAGNLYKETLQWLERNNG